MRLLIVSAAAMVAAASPLSLAAHADTVTLAADEWCPYNCEPGSQRPGYMVEIARIALAKAGHTLTYAVMPWSRALAESQAGRIDGVLGASRDEYESGVYPKASLGNNKVVLAMLPEKAKSFSYTGVESLKTLRIGGVQNYSYDGGAIDDYLASDAAKGKVEMISGSELQSQNLRKLLAGRVDAVIDDENVLRLALADLKPVPEVAFVPLLEDGDVSIGFSAAKPDAESHAKLIDETLVELRASGELGKILAKYGLADWAH